MNKKVTFIIFFIVLSFLLLGFIITFRSAFLEQTGKIFNGSKISLESRVPGKHLEWENQKELESILSELGIFDKGIKDLKTYEISQVDSLKIILVPDIQPDLSFNTKDSTVIYSGSYTIDNSQLTLSIYVNEQLTPDKDVTTAFNQEVLFFLVNLSTNYVDITGTQVNLNDRYNYMKTILENHFSNNKPYPIKVL